jgi:hypothetical protein
MRDYLHPQFAVRYAIHRSLAFAIGFQLKAVALLPSMLVKPMQYHAGIAHRLAAFLPDNQEV